VNSRSHDLFTTHFDLILHFFSLTPLVVYMSIRMPNLKYLASPVPKIWRGSQNTKSRSRDPFPTPDDLILHFFVGVFGWSILLPNLMFLASNVPEMWRK